MPLTEVVDRARAVVRPEVDVDLAVALLDEIGVRILVDRRDQRRVRGIGDVDDIDVVVRDHRVALAVRVDELDVVRVAEVCAAIEAELHRVRRIARIDHVEAILADQIRGRAGDAHVERVARSPVRAEQLADQREVIALAFDDAVRRIVRRADHVHRAHVARALVALRAIHPQRAIGGEVRDPMRLDVDVAVVGGLLAREQRIARERAARGRAIERVRTVAELVELHARDVAERSAGEEPATARIPTGERPQHDVAECRRVVVRRGRRGARAHRRECRHGRGVVGIWRRRMNPIAARRHGDQRHNKSHTRSILAAPASGNDRDLTRNVAARCRASVRP